MLHNQSAQRHRTRSRVLAAEPSSLPVVNGDVVDVLSVCVLSGLSHRMNLPSAETAALDFMAGLPVNCVVDSRVFASLRE
jgi:hypothetical protein